MAKISARGATKVESITSLVRYEGIPAPVVYTHTLCSDGRILRKTDIGTGYKQCAKVSVSAPDPLATFQAYVRRFEAARS
jgi:hypothetical protein